jgi:hypothetical protein
MNDEMEEIISEFITEAEESLDRIEPLFVELGSMISSDPCIRSREQPAFSVFNRLSMLPTPQRTS